MHGLSDTSPDVERRMIAGYRRMPAWRKVQLVTDAYRVARRVHAAGHRLRNPAATPADVNRAWAIMTLGPGPWIERMGYDTMSQSAEQVRPIKYVVSALDDLNIEYAIGGSYASSVHGVPRYTQDADLTVAPFPGKERLFALRFPAAAYYTDEGMIRDAVARRASFNVLDLETMFKIDVFVRKDRAFDRELFARRVNAPVFGESEGLFRVVSAEDTVLLKLEWYRLGGEVSDRQWGDVLGVLKTQAGRLDDAYLDHWAADLGVKDLLDKARARV
jgi:hypothetical protein